MTRSYGSEDITKRLSYFAAATAIFESPANLAHLGDEEGLGMDYRVDLDPTHAVIRLTVTAEILYKELAEEAYIRLQQLTAQGGPYAAIYDLSAVKDTTIPTDMVRGNARRSPSIPMGRPHRPHVVVGKQTPIYQLARIFQMCREHVYGLFEVVHTMEEAYAIVEVRPEDFTECLLPERLAA